MTFEPPVCAAGHHIVWATAFCDGRGTTDQHFLWGHHCPDDGEFWLACPRCKTVEHARKEAWAMRAIGGYLESRA